ncbi:hypothetical protein ASD24_29650 [Paenibacillus sp. Root52]|nr:hypothetical protein ASD24_29650 [Paenibacillus sp. Root52]
MLLAVIYDKYVCRENPLAILRVEVMKMKDKNIDSGSRLAQEILNFAKKNNMKIRKKRISPTNQSKGLQKNTTS